MKQFQYICLLFVFGVNITIAQVGVGTTNPNATLDIRSSNQAAPVNNDGLLIPKIDEFPVTNPTATQDGMLVFVTGNGVPTKGFYYWDAATINWLSATGAKQINDLIDGKSDNDGSQDGSSIFLGIGAGASDDGSDNRNIGIGYISLFSNTTGYRNTANGYSALASNTTGYSNTANGNRALNLNTTGNYNTANGDSALSSNTTGYSNTANGINALRFNTTGFNNTANGSNALNSNTIGSSNTANGSGSLSSNTEGSFNTASGVSALIDNTLGSVNTAIGFGSLYSNTIGNSNTSIGTTSLFNNDSGSGNIAIGYQSGYFELGSNKLYIENSLADSDNALIYGEFGVNSTATGNILRTNSQFQIGNPTLTGYAFPTTDGVINQVLQTDGSGSLNWVDSNTSIIHSINELIDGKSDTDGTDNGSSVFLGIGAGLNDDETDNRNNGIGYQSLSLNTSGRYNIANGYSSLLNNTTGNANVAIGYQTLLNNTTGSYNIAHGYHALRDNTTGDTNVAVGNNALYSNTTGYTNVANGASSLFSNTIGNRNTALGASALFDNTIGYFNVATGFASLVNNIDGNNNTALGTLSGRSVMGSNNVFLGSHSAGKITEDSKSGSIFIGYQSGYNETESNRLYVENSNANANNALIYGEFDNNNLTFNADVGINTITPSASLHVNHQNGAASEGFVLTNQIDTDAWRFYVQWSSNTLALMFNNVNVGNFDDVSGVYTAVSDRRLKTVINPYQSVLPKINELEIVDYRFKHQKDQRKYVGLIAQDVQKVFPHLVYQNSEEGDQFTMDYSGFGVLAIKAIQEQQVIIENQQGQIDELKKEIEEIKALIKQL